MNENENPEGERYTGGEIPTDSDAPNTADVPEPDEATLPPKPAVPNVPVSNDVPGEEPVPEEQFLAPGEAAADPEVDNAEAEPDTTAADERGGKYTGGSI